MVAEVIAYTLGVLSFSLLMVCWAIGTGFFRRCRRSGAFDEADRRSTARRAAVIGAVGVLCGMSMYVMLSLDPGANLWMFLLPAGCAIGFAAMLLLVFWLSTATLRRQLWLQKNLDRYRQSKEQADSST